MQICRNLFCTLYEKLKTTDYINLYEHSSFTHALNLRWENKIISILSEEKVLAPDSLTLPADFFADKFLHNTVFFTKGQGKSIILYAPTSLNKFVFTAKNCENLKLNQQLKINFNDAFIHDFFICLNQNKRQNSLFELIFEKKDPFCQEKYEKLKIHTLNADTDIKSLSYDLSAFLGLGPGLTPSGDDFILGFLFICTLYDVKFLSYIAKVLKTQLPFTNDISAAMLELALEKRFNLNLIKTAEYLQKINPADYNNCIDGIFSLKNYGHSSWQDCLLGIFTALLLLKA